MPATLSRLRAGVMGTGVIDAVHFRIRFGCMGPLPRRDAMRHRRARTGCGTGRLWDPASDRMIRFSEERPDHGSSGLAGSDVCAYLPRRGFRVHGLDDNQRAVFFGSQGDTRWNQERTSRTIPGFTHHELDVRDREGVGRLLVQLRPDVIVRPGPEERRGLQRRRRPPELVQHPGAFRRVEQRTGKPHRHVCVGEHRRGDHICYYSDLRKARRHYPGGGSR